MDESICICWQHLMIMVMGEGGNNEYLLFKYFFLRTTTTETQSFDDWLYNMCFEDIIIIVIYVDIHGNTIIILVTLWSLLDIMRHISHVNVVNIHFNLNLTYSSFAFVSYQFLFQSLESNIVCFYSSTCLSVVGCFIVFQMRDTFFDCMIKNHFNL